MRNEMLGAALVVGSLLAPGATTAQSTYTDLDHVVVEMADTAAEHEALAKHYTARARTYAATSSWRELTSTLEMRTVNSAPTASGLRKKYGEIATEYDELAKLHVDEARRLQ